MLDTKLINILDWIVLNWFPSIPELHKVLVSEAWISQLEVWVSENGVQHTVKRIKFLRLSVTRFLCLEPLFINDLMIGIDRDGFPSSLDYMKEDITSGDPERIRFIFTLLGISRAMSAEGKVDYSTITDLFKGEYKTLPKEFIDLFVRDFANLEFESEPISIKDFFLNLKSGPLSGPAILKAHLATRLYTGRNLWGLTTLLGNSGMKWFKELFISVWAVAQPQRNRKLHIIRDPELKMRVIAIFDYISQLAFEPISKHLFNILANIEQDRTFTQDPFIRDKREGESYHSLDLSAATDRFPIDLQVDLLDSIERASSRPYRGIGKAWKALMVNEPFLTPDGDLLHYEVGQPMGARSSWACFTLSHHCVVQKAAFDCGAYPFKEYVLLGDDIVIYNDAVAKRYKEIICSLGVDCSPTKSHVSSNTYEFAKRWFHFGIEVSPVPLKGLLANSGNPVLLFQDLLDLVYKGRGPKSVIYSSFRIWKNIFDGREWYGYDDYSEIR
nr:MAG: RNA-dependent RNA polymerase [Mitovirus sp.]